MVLSCIFRLTSSDVQVRSSLQNDIYLLTSTNSSLGLRINANKRFPIRFAPGSSSLLFTCHLPNTEHSDLVVSMERSLKFHTNIKGINTSVNPLTTHVTMCTLCTELDFLMKLYLTHVSPLTDFTSQIWKIGYCRDLEFLERRWTRAVRGLWNVPYEQWLRQLDLFFFQSMLLRAHLIYIWELFYQKCANTPDDPFQFPPLAPLVLITQVLQVTAKKLLQRYLSSISRLIMCHGFKPPDKATR